MKTGPLLSFDDCLKLDGKQVHEMFAQFIHPTQARLYSKFSFARNQVIRAEGVWLELQDGRKILDFTGGLGVLNLGHNHPRILAARRRYADLGRMEVHKNYFSPFGVGLAANLAKLLPEDLNLSFFPNSGAEAVEGAVKLAYKYHGGRRQRILCASNSFHGKLLGSGGLSGSQRSKFQFPTIPGIETFRAKDIESVKGLVDQLRTSGGESDIYALIVEPINATALTSLGKEFASEIHEICRREDIVLIFDEVFTGWFKTGPMFHFFELGVVPDILTMSKSFGGGKASISAYVTRQRVFDQAYGRHSDVFLHTSTYNGFGEEAATALEAVHVLVSEGYEERSRKIGKQLLEGLTAIQKKYPQYIEEVRGQGALCGLRLKPPRTGLFWQKLITASVIHHLYRYHQVLTYSAENEGVLLMAAPSLVATSAEIKQFLDALEATLQSGLLNLSVKFTVASLFR